MAQDECGPNNDYCVRPKNPDANPRYVWITTNHSLVPSDIELTTNYRTLESEGTTEDYRGREWKEQSDGLSIEQESPLYFFRRSMFGVGWDDL